MVREYVNEIIIHTIYNYSRATNTITYHHNHVVDFCIKDTDILNAVLFLH